MDIERAIKLIEKSDTVFAAVKDRKVIFVSEERGIKPALEFFFLGKETTQGSSVADRIIGKGAAMVLSLCCCKELYGGVISRDALASLKKGGQTVQWGTVVPYIINRRGDGMCPLEKLLSNTEDPQVGLDIIKKFLMKLGGK
ncbi:MULTISPECIES: DUF1893 domain-containing protein [Psychrilyobacter]|uniref:DUF1893 domain-containing protein n=1 Tax=Psychrilyobacter piezotolerans TaxID=2293438 RepID=A0ABX9KGB8_9FUSO|nr:MULTISPECIES: DUF1893 domain-containing protein [Psychrilyobacter]MCS5420975.1 DUF1893 domain-containing protein [Psychrilyobacter sp. S5]NDI78776.1 DUF1893 domain-containing protein [Psychrilyobacter piezotolerans]RDE60877.1 DUF1893 domain-containing protein [Psychrilyobacter sp. S5]REI40666.1 DUF1893 domain-containing protein [Psychrilyobacter piezotolerans]